MPLRAIRPCCPEKLPAPWERDPFLTETPKGGTKILRRLQEGGGHPFLHTKKKKQKKAKYPFHAIPPPPLMPLSCNSPPPWMPFCANRPYCPEKLPVPLGRYPFLTETKRGRGSTKNLRRFLGGGYAFFWALIPKSTNPL